MRVRYQVKIFFSIIHIQVKPSQQVIANYAAQVWIGCNIVFIIKNINRYISEFIWANFNFPDNSYIHIHCAT